MLYDHFIQNKNEINATELYIYEHFSELKRQIDIHREELKIKIDDIALEMTDKAKLNEEDFCKELNLIQQEKMVSEREDKDEFFRGLTLEKNLKLKKE